MSRNMQEFIGDQLRIARLARGLSLEQVAQAVGTTRQYIHQLENGSRTPAPDLVEALSDFLGVQKNFLFLMCAKDVRPEQCHFRKQQTTPASVISQVLARGSLLDRLINLLDQRLELPPVNFPDIPVTSLDDAEAAADEVRRFWHLGSDGPITNMMRVVENAGAVVTYFHGLSERVDALSMDRPRPIIVRSDLKESVCRLRFDLGHECGHLIMHRGVETGDKTTEDQAHRFSSAFLLPRSAFLQEFPRGRTMNWGAIFKLKLRWKVSARAIIRRAFDLRIIDSAQYRTANIQLVKTGQSKVERYDDVLPLEVPELLETSFSALQSATPDGVRKLADYVGYADGMFECLFGRSLPPSLHKQLYLVKTA